MVAVAGTADTLFAIGKTSQNSQSLLARRESRCHRRRRRDIYLFIYCIVGQQNGSRAYSYRSHTTQSPNADTKNNHCAVTALVAVAPKWVRSIRDDGEVAVEEEEVPNINQINPPRSKVMHLHRRRKSISRSSSRRRSMRSLIS